LRSDPSAPSARRQSLKQPNTGASGLKFAFEVKESDLLGRVGSMRVGGRTIETPYMFPVVHPVVQSVTLREIADSGFGGVMTNSYIIHSRKKDEAHERGVHDLLGFDGVVMTDSGGYQVLEYGDLEVDYREMASFQAAIGSDIAVTLDRPTGYPQERTRALDTMEYSLKNAVSTLKEFAGEKTTWVGPIQGGLYTDLVEKSASSMVEAGFEFLALGSPVQVMENYMFADLVRMVMAAKGSVPYSMPLHLFGAGHPLTMALAVAMGCDTFDSASYILFARTGRYMSRDGVHSLATMKYLPCSCQVCSKSTVRGLLEMAEKERVRALSIHNLNLLKEELEACKEAIFEGRLWDLLQVKSMAHPRLREAFLELVKHGKVLREGTPALKERGLLLRSAEDFHRPEIESAKSRLEGALRRRTKKAVLVVGGDTAPAGVGRGKKGGVDSADAYRLHPVLGPYPVELEFVYPFSQSTLAAGLDDGPSARRKAVAFLKRLGYASVEIAESDPVRPSRVKSRRSRRGASPSPP
jgi:7-cyano-7-deazaguanine tRNA-ribosyltransferase